MQCKNTGIRRIAVFGNCQVSGHTTVVLTGENDFFTDVCVGVLSFHYLYFERNVFVILIELEKHLICYFTDWFQFL